MKIRHTLREESEIGNEKKTCWKKNVSGWITSGKKNVGTKNLYRMYGIKIERICKWDIVGNALYHILHNDMILSYFYRFGFVIETSTHKLECNMRIHIFWSHSNSIAFSIQTMYNELVLCDSDNNICSAGNNGLFNCFN